MREIHCRAPSLRGAIAPQDYTGPRFILNAAGLSMQKSRTRGSDGVRIIGGAWRGRRIRIPAGTAVRPTPDRVRETLFNWLSDLLPGARCLDLFAGSGVLGFEALSRGANDAWLIERDPVLVRALEEQCTILAANARVIRGDALQVISTTPPESFDIVFADPPYEMDLVAVLRNLPAWVAHDNFVYVERQARAGVQPLTGLLEALPGARLIKESRAGGVSFGLLRLQT